MKYFVYVYVDFAGFRKEQLRVQITTARILKLSGERKISENRLRRFHRELPIPPDTDTSGISAKFESGILYVRLPKVITPIKSGPPTPTQLEAPKTEQQLKPEARNGQDQQKPGVVDKAEEPKTEKTEPPTPSAAPAPTPTPQEYKGDSQRKQEKEKGKAEEADARKVAKDERAEARILEKRSPTLELVSRQTQEYKNAVYGLVEEVKKQRKLANLVVVFLLVLLFVLYVNRAIKSYFGGTKSQEP